MRRFLRAGVNVVSVNPSHTRAVIHGWFSDIWYLICSICLEIDVTLNVGRLAFGVWRGWVTRGPDVPGNAHSFNPIRVTGHGCVFGAVGSICTLCKFRRVRAPTVRALRALVNGCNRRNSGLLFGVLGSNSCVGGIDSRSVRSLKSLGLTTGLYRGNLHCSLAIPFTHCIIRRHSRLRVPFGHCRVRPM